MTASRTFFIKPHNPFDRKGRFFQGTKMVLNGFKKFTNILLVLLYFLVMIMTLNFHDYNVNEAIVAVPAENRSQVDMFTLKGIQDETGIRQVRTQIRLAQPDFSSVCDSCQPLTQTLILRFHAGKSTSS